MKQNTFILICVSFFLASCTPIAANTPNINDTASSDVTDTAQPGKQASDPDAPSQIHGNVYLDSTELLTMESYPLQFTLVLKGSLPTPCDKLKINVNPPDVQNKIMVDVYSISGQDEICVQALQPFEENFPLGSFPAGHYTLWVNGKQIVEFDA